MYAHASVGVIHVQPLLDLRDEQDIICLLYTSDAADDLLCVDLGGRRNLKKKKKQHPTTLITINKFHNVTQHQH